MVERWLWLNWPLPLDSSSSNTQATACHSLFFSYCPSSYLSSLVLSTMLLGATGKGSHSQGPANQESPSHRHRRETVAEPPRGCSTLLASPQDPFPLPFFLTSCPGQWGLKPLGTGHKSRRITSECQVVRRPRDSLWTQTSTTSCDQTQAPNLSSGHGGRVGQSSRFPFYQRSLMEMSLSSNTLRFLTEKSPLYVSALGQRAGKKAPC